jgi:hypothetical protein
MSRRILLPTLAAFTLFTSTLPAADLSVRAEGIYLEARTCDVWTGPCFANADSNLTGKNAVMAWRIDKGQAGGTSIDGLSVVAVIAAHNTLGLEQRAAAKSVLLVDERATAEQREALVAFARQHGGELLTNVVAVQQAPISMKMCKCDGEVCAELDAGVARVTTRCLDTHHDKACGNEYAFYPPLASGVRVLPAGVTEHHFRGDGLGHTYSDNDRRGAYVGSFGAR